MISIIITSILLGIGLAMDAAAVSMANGLNYKDIKINKILLMALFFGVFQGAMPLIGYFMGSAILTKIEWIIPWVALIILSIIGIKMIIDGTKHDCGCSCNPTPLTIYTIFIQAIATSIDALSVGFTISNYSILEALVSAFIIMVVTFAICVGAVYIGKAVGGKLANKAEIFGGAVLLAIGVKILLGGI